MEISKCLNISINRSSETESWLMIEDNPKHCVSDDTSPETFSLQNKFFFEREKKRNCSKSNRKLSAISGYFFQIKKDANSYLIIVKKKEVVTLY